MLYWLGLVLKSHIFLFNVLRYITFRALMAVILSFFITLVLSPIFMRKVTALNRLYGGYVREDTPETHSKKKFVPSMGGLIIILSLELSSILLMRLDIAQTWIMAFTVLGFAIVGFIDDFVKLKNKKGISARSKMLGQIIVSFVSALLLYFVVHIDTNLYFPFFKGLKLNLGYFYIVFVMLVLIATSNAVNLTDGLDGLAIVPAMTTAFALGIISYVAGNAILAKYLEIHYVENAGELAIFGMAVVGAGLGFLWFNSFPAQMFMGDVGSLGLGAALGMLAIMSKQELTLIIAGGVFVVEALSVIIQVSVFKITKGKRVFKMAPIHHHFELNGTPEPKIVVRIWIVSILLAIFTIATLKLR